MARRKKNVGNGDGAVKASGQTVSLRELATHVGLSPTTLSLVLNDAPAAHSIPQETKDRIFEAVEKFNYRPNYFARSLRAQRSFTLGVLMPELSDPYSAMVLSGVEEVLLQEGYFYFSASHRHRANLIAEYPNLLLDRRVEGIIAFDTHFKKRIQLPLVTVSSHEEIEGVTNIILNHQRAAELALDHLQALGHQKIAFLKGQEFTSDTEIRWQSIYEAAKERNLEIHLSLTAQLEGDKPSSESGFLATCRILEQNQAFSALFAFNDVSAIGAIRALQESGRRVPEDVSVLGFDDIYAAAFHNPALTTIRQPLFQMGKLAAQTLLKRIAEPESNSNLPQTIFVEPELVVRQSTAQMAE